MAVHFSISAIQCNLCGSESSRTRFVFDGWAAVECSRCGLVYATPGLTPSEFDEIYREAYYTGGYDSEQDYVRAGDPQLLWQRLLASLERQLADSGVKGRRLLDVGCGLGYFVRAAGDRGWDACGVERSAWAASYARENLGVDVLAGELAAVSDSFDVITMWSFLEHVTDPLAVLAAARERLRNGGIICVGVPNIRSLDVLRSRRGARCFKREHLYYFSRATLHSALRAAGFREVRPLVFWGGVARSAPYLALQYLARWLGLSTQLTSWARR